MYVGISNDPATAPPIPPSLQGWNRVYARGRQQSALRYCFGVGAVAIIRIIYIHIHIYTYIFIYLSICIYLYIEQPSYISIYLSIRLSIYLSIYAHIHTFISMYKYMCV